MRSSTFATTTAAVTATAVSRAPAGALGLYPLWCAFATALSSRIWWLNR